MDNQVIRGACPHDCPDTCAWLVTVENGKAVQLTGDKNHLLTRGGLCAKVNHFLEDRVYGPDRLLYPLRRVGRKGEGRFERVNWDEALDNVAINLKRIIKEVGPTAILPYSYLGTMGMVQGASLDRRFFARLGATRLVRAICGGATDAGLLATNGTTTGIRADDLIHSRFIILWGTNTIVTNLHLWPLILEARKNGSRVVVIDPIKTRTATQADWHIQPKPGTDAALALGMMHVIIKEELYDEEYVAHYTQGFDQLKHRIDEYPPPRVAAITGLDAEEIITLARAYATTRPALIRTLIGMSHHANAAGTWRAIACLPALVGAWRDLGGGLLLATISQFEAALNFEAVEMPELEDQTIRTVNMVQLGKALTDSTLDPPIRSLIIYNCNPVAITPNQNLVLTGLQREDLFTVVIEQFLTDTTRYADYVFPATTQIEHFDLMWSWGHTYLALNQPAIHPVGEALPNTEFFRRLSTRMGFNEPYLYDSDEDLVRAALSGTHPYLEGITFERLSEHGWAALNLPEDWRPFAEGGFPTPSGKCQFYAASSMAEGIDPLPAYVPREVGRETEGAARYPLNLLTSKSTLYFLNSSYANLARHLKAEKEPRLDIHPDDAVTRGLEDGDLARISNDRGSVEVRVKIGRLVRPGIVAMPSGWWPSQSPTGSSANALTGDGLTDLGGGSRLHDTLVEVRKVA